MIKKLSYDSYRKDFYETEIVRYENLIDDLINQYIININKAIETRLNSYVDPYYVDAGYVSPN